MTLVAGVRGNLSLSRLEAGQGEARLRNRPASVFRRQRTGSNPFVARCSGGD